MDARCPGPPGKARRPQPARELLRRWARLGLWVGFLTAGAELAGCAHEPPVKPWQRGYTARRAMTFDDGLESRFKQHVFSAREGAEGGYGHFSGGCGCN
jgi:hypothetical protein